MILLRRVRLIQESDLFRITKYEEKNITKDLEVLDYLLTILEKEKKAVLV